MMLVEVSELFGELGAMAEAGVSSVPVLYVLGRLKGLLAEGAAQLVPDSDTGTGGGQV